MQVNKALNPVCAIGHRTDGFGLAHPTSLFVIAVILSALFFVDLQGSVSSHDFPDHLGTVELPVEIGIQVVSLVGHQGAEWPIGRRDTPIA